MVVLEEFRAAQLMLSAMSSRRWNDKGSRTIGNEAGKQPQIMS